MEPPKGPTNPRNVSRTVCMNAGTPFRDAQSGSSFTRWAPIKKVVVDGMSASDPVQGTLGNCYLIAALSAVAATAPERLRCEEQANGVRFTFFREGQPNVVEVEPDLPVYSEANVAIYGHSAQKGEAWPALYEKAYAKWKNGESDDEPDYQAIAGGNPAGALAELTGLPVEKHRCSELSESDLLNLLKLHGPERRLQKATVTWTFGSPAAADLQPVLYDTVNLLPAHAYTLLGWEETSGEGWVVLRNPLGRRDITHPTVAPGDRVLRGGFWRTAAMKDPGVIALELQVFRRHFNKLAIAG